MPHQSPPFRPAHDALWRRADGSAVACVEKLKVLNDNYAELRCMLQDALDDALLMGCAPDSVRAAFAALLAEVQPSVTPSPH